MKKPRKFGRPALFSIEDQRVMSAFFFVALLLSGVAQVSAQPGGVNPDFEGGSASSVAEGFYGGFLLGLVLASAAASYALLFIIPNGGKSPPIGGEIVPESDVDQEPDHSLACAVADSIERIHFRLRNMDESDQDKGAIVRMLERLDMSLENSDYQRVEISGRPYDDGMACNPQFIESKDPAHEKPTIVRVVKAQVHFKGKLIQEPEIHVGTYYRQEESGEDRD